MRSVFHICEIVHAHVRLICLNKFFFYLDKSLGQIPDVYFYSNNRFTDMVLFSLFIDVYASLFNRRESEIYK